MTEERLVELLKEARKICRGTKDCKDCVGYGKGVACIHYLNASHMVANGVTVREKGEWVITKRHTASKNPYMDDNYHIRAECSECNFCIHAENRSFGYAELNTTNYCPNCGADMRGEHESD